MGHLTVGKLFANLVQVEKAGGGFGVLFIEAATGGNHAFVRGCEEGEKNRTNDIIPT